VAVNHTDIERLVVGFACSFDVPTEGRDLPWSAWQLRKFLDSGLGLPLKVEHGRPEVFPNGTILDTFGTAFRFAVVEADENRPSGLLTLVELDRGEVGYGWLQEFRDRPWAWGLSLGAWVVDGVEVMPYEISIVAHPAFEFARILATGHEALRIWDLLASEPSKDPYLTTHVYPVEVAA
jgi:hypothetical protein